MGYYIRKVATKKPPHFKVQFITYRKGDGKNPDSPEKIKDIRKIDWQQHGFALTMSVEDAQAKAKSLNAVAEVKRWGEKKAQIRENHGGAIEVVVEPGSIKQIGHTSR